jgi:hypothetical protein
MPDQRHFSPAWGKSVGGAKRRPARVAQEKSCRSSCMCRWKAPWAPGSRRPSRGAGGAESSAGPSRSQWVSSPAGGRAGDIGVSPGRRGRERRRRTRIKAYAPEPAGTVRSAPRATRPSLGPGTRASSCRAPRSLTQAGSSSRPGSKGFGRLARGSRETRREPGSPSGKPGEISEEPSSGMGRQDAARLAVCRAGSRGFGLSLTFLMHQNRDGGCGLLPRTRGHVEPRAKCSYVVAVAEVVRLRQVSNKLACRPPKRGPARVNGDLARGGRRQSASQDASLSASAPCERTNENRAAPWNQGAGSAKSQGGVRASLGGSWVSQDARGSWDRGGPRERPRHRILGRAP